MKKIKFLLVVFFLTTLGASAQVKIGDNPTSLNGDAVLEMESASKGMLLPRVALTSTTAAAPLSAHVAGMTVYNTATAGDVTPGLYYNDGTKWVSLTDCHCTIDGSTGGSGVVSGFGTAVGCSAPTIDGTMTQGVPVSGVTMKIYAKVTKKGTYDISTTANGVTFSGKGNLTAAVGDCQEIVLTATGTPKDGGAQSWTTNTTPAVTINSTVEAATAAQAVKFVNVVKYNGPSPFDKGVGFYKEAVPASSTIEVAYTSTVAGIPYTFTATDATTGLEYTASGTTLPSGTVSLVPNGATVNQAGVINMTLTGASNTLALSPRIDIKSLPANQTEVVDVTVTGDWDNDSGTPDTDMIWMDRNLGAHQVATAPTDGLAYGNNYQWGRGSDGHEIVVTHGTTGARKGLHGTTTTLATSNTPGNDLFITDSNTSPYDWRSPQEANLWQGVNGVNNPCPTGYRLPTKNEQDAMVRILGITNSQTAFDSSLKFSVPGYRDRTSGSFNIVGSYGYYWSSTTNGSYSYRRNFNGSTSNTGSNGRVYGFTVRCLKN